MWIYKSCPKCRGDIFVEEDIDNCYIKCLQCGYEKELSRKPNHNKNRTGVKDRLGRLQIAHELK
jgi:DNA-directed RNA polymerase subunit M/transcription elongation factor TFIIS